MLGFLFTSLYDFEGYFMLLFNCTVFNLEVWEGEFIFFYLCFTFFLYLQSIMTDPLSSPTPAPLHSLLVLNLNLNLNLNPKTTVHDDMNSMKYRQPNTLYELVLFIPLQHIVSHAMFKVTSFVDFRPYLMLFNSVERYISSCKGN